MLLRAGTVDDDCSDVMKDDMTHTIIEDSVGHDDKETGLLADMISSNSHHHSD